jgi:hypothetical protein
MSLISLSRHQVKAASINSRAYELSKAISLLHLQSPKLLGLMLTAVVEADRDVNPKG